MIVRRNGPDFVLVTQHDHSLLSGELAKKVGNGLFAPPSPFESVVMGIGEHDCGWDEADQHPQIDAAGEPVAVFETDLMTSLHVWDQSVERSSARDPYAGLLVSLHTMNLANLAAARHRTADDEVSRQRVFRVRRFIHRQIEVQEQLRRRLEMRTDLPLRGGLAEQGRSPEEDLLRSNYFLLEFLDQVSLNLCFDRVIFQRIEMLYPRPGEGAIGGRIAADKVGGMTIHPWPFNCECLDLDVPAKQVAGGPYRNAESLRVAWESGQRCVARVVLRPGGS